MAPKKPLVKNDVSGGSQEIASSDIIQLVGMNNYPPSATDPTTPPPSEGDRYYNTSIQMEMRYDATRGKWLSIGESVLYFGRNTNTAPGSYYKAIDGRTYSATLGQKANFSGTVISIAYTRSDSDSATFEVTSNGSSLVTLLSTSTSGRSNALNADFSQDDILSVKNQSGGNTTSDVVGSIRLRWRV